MPTNRERALVLHIATNVMGWILEPTCSDPNSNRWWLNGTGDPVMLDGVYNPLSSADDALASLEAWRRADEELRSWYLQSAVIGFDSEEHRPTVTLVEFSKENVCGQGTTLAQAICEALCKATGFQWEDPDD